MHKEVISRSETGFFSNLSIQLVEDQESLKPFIHQPFSKESLIKQANLKKSSFAREKRKLLHNSLTEQLSNFDHKKVKKNQELLLEDNTLTITTGHQLNLYTGPLYVVYKVMHVIKLAEEMNSDDPDNNYIPLFWMATEDHDFEEINHFHLFNDTITWETSQNGPVGRFNLNDFDRTKKELLEKFQNNESFADFLSKQYKETTLAEATRNFVMELFADYGLLVLDADDSELKQSFAPIIKQELTESFAEELVNKKTKELEEKGYDGQVTPRPINLFYITDERRDRIIPSGDHFSVGDDSYSKEELLELLEKYPERFSPNVVLRPVYQEFILPNVCYVGGGGEMSYWLQLKGVFDHLDLLYPIIQVRNSIQYIDGIALKKMKKLDISVDQLFDGIHKVKKQYVLDNEEDSLDFTELDGKRDEIISLIESTVISVDKALEGYGKSESTKLTKQIDGLKQKLIRHQKKKHDDAMAQIENLFERLFPAGGLQERYDNVIPKLAKYGQAAFIEELHNYMDPFENGLILLIED